MICINNLGVDCRARGIVYQITCGECENEVEVKNKYRGQTGRSAYERINEHYED